MVKVHVALLIAVSCASFKIVAANNATKTTIKSNKCTNNESYQYSQAPNNGNSNSSTSCNGDPNAYLSTCATNCGRLCSNYNKGIVCPAVCRQTSGCTCKTNYVFDENTKRCVLPKQCTPVCKKDEIYNDCTNSGCVPQNCTQLGYSVPCVRLDPADCIGGCDCAEGKLRAKNGTCVPKEQCGTPCGGDPNAVPGCGSNCGQRCSSRYNNQTEACPLASVCNLNGCNCKKGYLLDDVTGKCVKPENCSITCGKNETFSSCVYPSCSSDSCADKGKQFNCPILSTSDCVAKCVCKSGYLRDQFGNCVLESSCPNSTPMCEPDEVYNSCVNAGCVPFNCTQLGFPVYCARLIEGACIGACVCKEGFLRTEMGNCVPKEQCSTCGGDPNAVSGCGGNCGRHCSDLNNEYPVACRKICDRNGCDCKEGYWFNDETGMCVLPEQCQVACSDENEEYSDCVNDGCEIRNCAQFGTCLPCEFTEPSQCVKGCVCKKGYLRANNGVCVAKSLCNGPCNGDPNAVPGCGNHCGNSCATYSIRDTILCLAVCYNNGCDCKPGFVFDENTEKCVPLEQCTPPICKDNEVYKSCVNTGCEPQTCDDLKNTPPCIQFEDKTQCVGGCVCQDGYLRDNNGDCVPKQQCELSTCGKNEVFSSCVSGECQPQYCGQKNLSLPCPLINSEDCVGGCVCEAGYYRNSKGECIPGNECPTSCNGDPNALPGCGVNCGRDCSNYFKKNVACILVCYADGCDCKPGYVFDSVVKKCVKPSQCSILPNKCGINEEYSNCVNGICRAQNCAQKGQKIACDGSCTEGCVCKANYLRSSNGTCVPEDQCDVCPEGEYYSTCPPAPCDAEYCPLSSDAPLACLSTKNCGKPRCTCGFNRHRDRETGKCIATSQCPPFPCEGPHEVYNSCPPVCPGQNCLDYINNSTCSKFGRIGIVVACQPKCRCEEGYYRNKDGICVSRRSCEKEQRCNANEVYSKCTNGGCDARNCSQLGKPVPCKKLNPDFCLKGCVCRKGYLRNKDGDCVLSAECKLPPVTCGDNEIISSCVNGGCDKRNCSQVNSPQICIDLVNGACIRGCVCKSGFLRNKSGKCIPQDQCPENKCKRPNEIFDTCPLFDDPQTCETIGKPKPTSSLEAVSVCVGKCRCKPNFYRNKLGDCISEENCLKCNGPHEYYSCGGFCDNVCSELKQQNQTNCPIVNIKCNEKCYCEKDYARDENNICVPIKDCNAKACPEGEVYSNCPPASCDADYCPLHPNAPTACVSTKECKPPRCVCAFNYRRDRDTQKCVPVENCPAFSCSGKHEQYVACPKCPGQKCSDYMNNSTSPLYLPTQPCKPDCVCKKDYYKNDDNKCVHKSKCK